MPTFTVYPDGMISWAKQSVDAPTAREAAEKYWEENAIAISGTAADEKELIIVEHEDGPNVDPSASWFMKDGSVFARFEVLVTRIEAVAVELK